MPWDDLEESLHELFYLSQNYRYEDAITRRASDQKAYASRYKDFARERRASIRSATHEQRRIASEQRRKAAREQKKALALLHEKQRAKILKAWQDAHKRDVEKRDSWHSAKQWFAPIKRSQNQRKSLAQLRRSRSVA